MKASHLALSAFLLYCSTAVHAAGLEEAAGDARAKHLAVAAEQRQLDADLSRKEIDCYKRFAVNTCLDTIRVQRRNVMAILERDENLLKDAERKTRGAQQIRKTGEKSLSAQPREVTDPRTALAKPYPGFSASVENKDRQLRNIVASQADARRAVEERLSVNRKKPQARIDKETGSVQKAREFQKRQDESLNRRLQHQAGQTERRNSASKPLPLPTPLPQ